MSIEKLDAGKHVVWKCHGDHPEWGGIILTWDLTRQDDGTIVRFTHGNWRSISDFCVMCNSTWGELMYRLKDYAEGKNPGPHWRD